MKVYRLLWRLFYGLFILCSPTSRISGCGEAHLEAVSYYSVPLAEDEIGERLIWMMFVDNIQLLWPMMRKYRGSFLRLLWRLSYGL
jgi:hypothetical protein